MVVFMVTVIPPIGTRLCEVHLQMTGWRDPLDRIDQWHVRHHYIIRYLGNYGYSAHSCYK